MSNKFKLLDLFSGIGGFSLGLERSGYFETVAFCEIDPFCRRVLKKHWPEVPQYDDVKTLTAARLASDGIAVDAICGGFPCQKFSTASRGRNIAPDLWPHMERIIGEIKPEFVISENVTRGAVEQTVSFCRELGLSSFSRRISADDIGADHKRNRWWAIAHPNADCELQIAIDAEVAIMRSLQKSIWGPENYRAAICLSDGVPSRLDETTPLGNAVVPQIPELIGCAIGKSFFGGRTAA